MSFQRAARTDKHVSAASNIISLKISVVHLNLVFYNLQCYHWLKSFLPFLISILKLHECILIFCQYLYILNYYREEKIKCITIMFLLFNYKLCLWWNLIPKFFFINKCFIIIRNYMHILIVNFGFHYMVTNVENFLDNVNGILPNQIRMLGNVFDYSDLYDCGHNQRWRFFNFNDKVCCMNVHFILHVRII